ncbi:MAG: TIGR00282 family metallophosphoesterase [Arcobacteraceae bacterium]|jgi:metallophosphoesterase (TIGR00282 family)
MRVAFIGDIIGRPGRNHIKKELKKIRETYSIDFVIANGENASHGFGITHESADELLKCGIDVLTGGNHTWDKKKDILALLKTAPVMRPHNYPDGVDGTGLKIFEVNNQKIAILNLMGIYGMPQVTNPFLVAQEVVEQLNNDGIFHIFVDFHGEATAEKRVMYELLKGNVSAICGTHTHIGTDDFEVANGTFYVTDIGLTGCRDNVIGMDSHVPLQKALTGLGGHFDIPKSCKTIFQMMIVDVDENGKAIDGMKLKLFSDQHPILTQALLS